MRLSFIAHDYVEYIEGDKTYTINLIHDKQHNPIGWQREITELQHTPKLKIHKRYNVEEVIETPDNRIPILKKFFG